MIIGLTLIVLTVIVR
ncbi:hypothetical protein [Pantoea agglomerans]